MGFFKRLRRLANPLGLNSRRPLNPAGLNFKRPFNPAGINFRKPFNPAGVKLHRWGRFVPIEGPVDRPKSVMGLSDNGLPDVSFSDLTLSDDLNFSALADGPTSNIWSNLGAILGGAASKVIDAKAQAEVIKAQAALYTPQNIETMRRQADFEAAKAGGLSTGAMIGLGLGALALVLLLKRK